MKRKHHLAAVLLSILVLSSLACADESSEAGNAAVFDEFVGSSPCGEAIRPLLDIPASANAELIEWKLMLYKNPQTLAPSRYKLRCEYGPTTAGKPGLGKTSGTVEREGRWTIAKGTRSNSEAIVYELADAVSLFKVDQNVLHVLNGNRSLMNGTGGWSYTLNRTASAEKPVDPKLATSAPDLSYRIAEVSTGPSVFGVFEGRTPYEGIARELKLPIPAGANKAKWRVTLYQDATTKVPTTYKVEGTLFRQDAREGNWSLVRGTPDDAMAMVYRLSPSKTQRAILLLRGDENVLFLVNQGLKPMVGHAEFSYTLNRRAADLFTGPAQPAAERH